MHRWCFVLSLLVASSAWAKKPVVAVFDVEDKGAGLAAETLNRITDYLASSLAATGAYQVIPRSTLKQRLSQQKKDSYRKCYEESCQIDIGRELAAEKSLSTQVIKIAAECLVTSIMYDLKRSASEGGARAEGGCSEKEILGSIKTVISTLVPKSAAPPEPAPPAPASAAAPAASGPQVTVDFESRPAGADVFIDGLSRGVTPLRTTLAPGRSYELTLERKGYEAVKERVSVSGRRTLAFALKPTAEWRYRFRTRTEWIALQVFGGGMLGYRPSGAGGGGIGLFTLKWDRVYWTILEWFALGGEDTGFFQWGSQVGYPMYLGARGAHQLRFGVTASVGMAGHDMGEFAFVLSPVASYQYQTTGRFFYGGALRAALPVGFEGRVADYSGSDTTYESYYTTAVLVSFFCGWASSAD